MVVFVAGEQKTALDGIVGVVQMGRFEPLVAEDEHNSDGDVGDRRQLVAAVEGDRGAVEDIHLDDAGYTQAED